MEAEKLAFWGIALQPGQPADLELEDGETLHLTMVSYGPVLPDPKGRSVVTARINSPDDSTPKVHALAVLNPGTVESRIMDVSFIGKDDVTLQITGKNPVHLIGNFSFEDGGDESDDEDDGDQLIDEYDDDTIQGLVRVSPDLDDDPPVIKEIVEEEDNSPASKALAVVPKKGKKENSANGKLKPKTSRKSVNFSEPILSSEEEEESDDEEEDKPSEDVDMIKPAEPEPEPEASSTPKSKKSKRKKKKSSNPDPEEPTPSPTKKSKISQRPGTPAAVKSVSRTPKDASKELKKANMNGSAAADPNTPSNTPVKEKDAPSGSTPGTRSTKRKRKKGKKTPSAE